MTTTTKKNLGWSALAAGAGGTLLFALLCAAMGPPRRLDVYIWPVATVVLTLLAIRSLRRSYKLEPAGRGGLWQLSMRDLLVASFVAATLLAIAKNIAPPRNLVAGLLCALFLTLLFVAGLLVGARQGIERAAPKYCFAAGFMLRTYGALGVGGAGVFGTFIFLLAGRRESLRFCRQLLALDYVPGLNEWLMYGIRAAFAALLVGLLVCRWVLRTQGRAKQKEGAQ